MLRNKKRIKRTQHKQNNLLISNKRVSSGEDISVNDSSVVNEVSDTNDRFVTKDSDLTQSLNLINLRLSRLEELIEATNNHLKVPDLCSSTKRFLKGDLNNVKTFIHQFSYGEIKNHCGKPGVIIDESATHVMFKTEISCETCILTIEKSKFGIDGNFVMIEKI